MSDVFEAFIEQKAAEVAEQENSGMESPENVAEAEVVQEQEQPSGMEETPVQENVEEQNPVTETQQPVAVDYLGWLKEKSGGLFESEESFASSLEKFKAYDDLVKQKETLEKNQLPEDQFVKSLADLRSKGASQEQIKEFVKINTEYEDLSTLDPLELKVAKMVLVDGYSKKVATAKVEREFGLSDLEEGTEEYDIAKEDLRISSKNDLQALQSYKAKLTTVDVANTLEQSKLQEQAIFNAHKATVKETVPQLLSKFTGLGQVSLKETIEGDEIVSDLGIDYDDDFKAAIPEMLEALFSREVSPITEQSLAKAKEEIDAVYLKNNYEKLFNTAFKNGIALGLEKADNKYTNRNGLKETTEEQNISKDAALQAEWAAFEKKVEKWR